MSKPIFVCYPRCTTCKKAEKWLADHGTAVTVRDIKENNPTEQELRSWHEKSGVFHWHLSEVDTLLWVTKVDEAHHYRLGMP